MASIWSVELMSIKSLEWIKYFRLSTTPFSAVAGMGGRPLPRKATLTGLMLKVQTLSSRVPWIRFPDNIYCDSKIELNCLAGDRVWNILVYNLKVRVSTCLSHLLMPRAANNLEWWDLELKPHTRFMTSPCREFNAFRLAADKLIHSIPYNNVGCTTVL